MVIGIVQVKLKKLKNNLEMEEKNRNYLLYSLTKSNIGSDKYLDEINKLGSTFDTEYLMKILTETYTERLRRKRIKKLEKIFGDELS